MSAALLLAELHQRGVVLSVLRDGALRYRAPKGALTPELREAVARQKPQLRALLMTEAPPATKCHPATDASRNSADLEAGTIAAVLVHSAVLDHTVWGIMNAFRGAGGEPGHRGGRVSDLLLRRSGVSAQQVPRGAGADLYRQAGVSDCEGGAVIERPDAVGSGHSAGTAGAETRANGGRAGRAVDTQSAALGWPRLLDIDTAAAYVGLTRWTLIEYVHDGSLPVVRPPRAHTPRARGYRQGKSRRTMVNDHLRRLLIDRHDLDNLVDAWKRESLP